MTVKWLFDNCQWLYLQIQDLLSSYQSCGFVPYFSITGAGPPMQWMLYSPLSTTMLPQLQHAFNDGVKKAMVNRPSFCQQWLFWNSTHIQLAACIPEELQQVSTLLDIQNPHSVVWQ